MRTVLQKIGVTADIPFPRLRELKGKHRLTNDDLANIMGAKTHQTTIKRLREGDFTMDEMLRIERYFKTLGEKDTISTLFFDWLSTIVE